MSTAHANTDRFGTHLSLKLAPNAILLICLYDDMVVIEVLDDEALFLVQREQDLLHGRIADAIDVSQNMDRGGTVTLTR